MTYTIKSSGDTFATLCEARASLKRCGLAVVSHGHSDRGEREPRSYAIADDYFGGTVDTLIVSGVAQ